MSTQAANNRLRLELDRHSENRNLMSLPSHFESTTHAELVQRIGKHCHKQSYVILTVGKHIQPYIPNKLLNFTDLTANV